MKRKIVSWLKQEVRNAGAKGIVMGLSGGIDSAVVAALAREAVGKKRVLALILPCRSHPADLKDAKAIVQKLGIKTKALDLSVVYNNLLKLLPEAGNLTKNNLKPRLRMSVFYYFANKLNYLVCGTGNKSEIKVGYYTKYGDGAVDLLPIGDLLKRQVKALAQELGIPENIITKPPTAGLWSGQTDEAEMGITYPELDDILGLMEKRQKQVLPADKINKVKKMIKRSEHKRRLPKVCYI